jgi:hypothetical protein
MAAISFRYGSRASGNLSARRSLDTPEGKSREIRSSKLFCVSAHGYAAVLGRVPIISLRGQIGSSSRKEKDPIVAQIDRPILVVRLSDSEGRVVSSTRSAGGK